jgi:hypothetical protein
MFLLVCFSTLALKYLNFVKALLLYLRKYTHDFLENSSVNVMKYFEPLKEKNFSGPPRSVWMNSNIWNERFSFFFGNCSLCYFPNWQHLHVDETSGKFGNAIAIFLMFKWDKLWKLKCPNLLFHIKIFSRFSTKFSSTLKTWVIN